MIYNIISLEIKTTASGSNKRATLMGENGQETKGVTIWPDFPTYSSLTVGGTVEGDIVSKQNGKWTNTTLYQSRPGTPANRSFTPKTGGMAQAVDKKNQNIAISQERKEEGIMTSSTIRMAVDIVSAQGIAGKTDEEIKEKIMKYRYWLVEKWNQTSPIKVAGTDTDYPENNEPIPF